MPGQAVSEDGQLVCGVDEAGRGALAGPVIAAAVLCHPHSIPGLDDSKKISDARRRSLVPLIRARSLSYALGSASAQEIDRHNIREATKLAFQRALHHIRLPRTHVPILIDGDFVPELDRPARSIIRGDSKYEAIMAASILAKVTRDDQLIELDSLYPSYGFGRHKGYGTPSHMHALARYGPCAAHRLSFAPLKPVQK